jgi:hypothetical protein
MKEATCPLQEILRDSFEFAWSKEQSWTSNLKKQNVPTCTVTKRDQLKKHIIKRSSPCNFRKAQAENRVIVLPSVNLGAR